MALPLKPDDGGTNGRLRGIQSVCESSPAGRSQPLLPRSHPDLCGTLRAAGAGSSQLIGFPMQRRGTRSRHTSAAKLLLRMVESHRQSIEALRLVFHVAVFFLSLTMGFDHHFDHHLCLSTEICPCVKFLFSRKIRLPGTFLDALPMSGGQGVASSNLASPDQRSEREIGFRQGRHHHRRGSRHPGRCG